MYVFVWCVCACLVCMCVFGVCVCVCYVSTCTFFFPVYSVQSRLWTTRGDSVYTQRNGKPPLSLSQYIVNHIGIYNKLHLTLYSVCVCRGAGGCPERCQARYGCVRDNQDLHQKPKLAPGTNCRLSFASLPISTERTVEVRILLLLLLYHYY